MELLNIISFIFLVIGFIGGLAFPVFFLVQKMSENNKYQASVLVLLWLILLAVLAGVGALITA